MATDHDASMPILGMARGPGRANPPHPGYGKLGAPLTDRQQEIYDYIVEFRRKNGFSPTIREIGEHTAIRSPNGVKAHISSMRNKGYITFIEYLSRSIVPTNPDAVAIECPTRFESEVREFVAMLERGEKARRGKP